MIRPALTIYRSRPFSLFLLVPLLFFIGAIAPAQNAITNPEIAAVVKQGDDALAAKNFDEAAKAFKKANKLAHDNCSSCWAGLASALEGQGDAAGAKNSAGKAISTATNDSDRAEAYAVRGDALMLQSRVGAKYEVNKLKEAEADYRTALQLAPQKAPTYIRLGSVLCKEMRDDEAKVQFQTYLQMAPNGP